MHFEQVRKIKEDALTIMNWRNNPETLSMSFHSSPKKMPAFYDEFLETYFLETKCPPLFAIHNNQRIAFLKFSRYDYSLNKSNYFVDIGINLNPDFRRQGLGSMILTSALKYLKNVGVDGIIAEIKPENTASLKIFSKAGFTNLGLSNKYISDLNKTFPIIIMEYKYPI
jgi:RimJ/RimL family protein N-acetyltransferase